MLGGRQVRMEGAKGKRLRKGGRDMGYLKIVRIMVGKKGGQVGTGIERERAGGKM